MKKMEAKKKEKILKESYEDGCTIRGLGKKYGVSEKTIYRWRKEGLGRQNIPKSVEKFIEVPIKKEVSGVKLKKAQLVYENHKIEIEGVISSTKLALIMQILEAE